MKTKRLFIPLLILCIALLAMTGCSAKYITDIAGYEDMQTGGDKIEVKFGNGTQYGFTFTIEDKADIDEIVNLVLTTELKNSSNRPVAPGDNTHFTVYQGENTYRIALSGVWAGDERYSFTSDELREKINAVATERGAFDNSSRVEFKFSSLEEYTKYYKDREISDDGKIIVALTDAAGEHIEDYTAEDFSEINAVSIEILSSIRFIFVTIPETDRDSVLRASYILHLRSDVIVAEPNLIHYFEDDMMSD